MGKIYCIPIIQVPLSSSPLLENSKQTLEYFWAGPRQEMEEEGNASEDRLGGDRERVPLSALFGGSGQHVPEQAPGGNEASRHSFTGLSWRRASPNQAPSSQENHTPEPTDQNGCVYKRYPKSKLTRKKRKKKPKKVENPYP